MYDEVILKAESYLEKIPPVKINELIENFNRPATKAEILMEMLEHSIHHRGQLFVYLRFLGIKPVQIPYIV